MCLLVLAWNLTPEQPLFLIGNRDEYHARATQPLAHRAQRGWTGGLDLQAGGTWMAADAQGRFGVITNRPEIAAPTNAKSRGYLITEYLEQNLTPLAYAEQVSAKADHYAGFCLLLGDRTHMIYVSNDHRPVQVLRPGLYGLGNHGLDAQQARLSQAKAAVALALKQGVNDTARLWEQWGPTAGENTDSARFIVGSSYGTRATTLLTLSGSRMRMEERSYDAHGLVIGDQSASWTVGGDVVIA